MKRLAAMAAMATGILLAATSAQAQRTAYGKYIRAARALNEWRFDDARKLITKLTAQKPRAKETRYLRAEMAFLKHRTTRAVSRPLVQQVARSRAGAV